MIKELFATCLLSASVGTSGLNMQTRDNQLHTFVIDMITTDATPTMETITNTDDKAYTYRNTYTQGNIVTVQSITKGYKSMYDEYEYNHEGLSSIEITCVKIHTTNLVITNSKLMLDYLQYNLEQQQYANNVNVGTMIISDRNTDNYESFINLNYKNYTDMYIFATNTNGFAYNIIQQHTANYNNNVIDTDWTNNNINISGITYDTYIYIITMMDCDDGDYLEAMYNTGITQYKNSGLKLQAQYGFSQNTEIINIPGLMFTVLTLPFTFISQAFNLTLFEGTPYQINISALFLSIIAVLIFAFILSLIIKKK